MIYFSQTQLIHEKSFIVEISGQILSNRGLTLLLHKAYKQSVYPTYFSTRATLRNELTFY